MKVKNVNGSSSVSPKAPSPFKSWIEYWQKHSEITLERYSRYKCPACKNHTYGKDFHGSHVTKYPGFIDKSWYILPLCQSCNNKRDEVFDIGDIDLLIPMPSNL